MAFLRPPGIMVPHRWAPSGEGQEGRPLSISCKSERALLSHEEFEMVRTTHHPAIYDLDGKELRGLKGRMRQQRDKARGLTRHKQREMRGKAEPRGKSIAGDAEQPLKRKQIFAAALKRINKELDRLRKLEARDTHVEAARQALALRRAAQFVHHPAAGPTSRGGMQPFVHVRRRTRVPPRVIGSISQATKVAQAIRDSKR
jgi:hypothetical protein